MSSVAHRYSDVFAALDAAEVRYVIVGRVAVNFYSYPRLTIDLELRTSSAASAVAVLVDMGFRCRLVVDAECRSRGLFSFYDPQDPMLEIDISTDARIPFDELFDASVVGFLGDVPVRIASREHMIAMERTGGPPHELQELDRLRDTEDIWEAATFEGSRRDQERRWATIPWPWKWEWLGEALQLAKDTGALEKALARKQADIDGAWADAR